MFNFIKKLFKPHLSSFTKKVLDDLAKYPLWEREEKHSPLSWTYEFSHPELKYTVEWSVFVGWWGKLCSLIPRHEHSKVNDEIRAQIQKLTEIKLKKAQEEIS